MEVEVQMFKHFEFLPLPRRIASHILTRLLNLLKPCNYGEKRGSFSYHSSCAGLLNRGYVTEQLSHLLPQVLRSVMDQ